MSRLLFGVLLDLVKLGVAAVDGEGGGPAPGGGSEAVV